METQTLEIIDPRITKLRKLLEDIQRNILECGQLIVSLIDDGISLRQITLANGWDYRMLRLLERVGRDLIIPLLFATFPAARRLQYLPKSEQEELLNNPVDVLVLNEGKPDTLKVPIQDLTATQVNQVFQPGLGRGLRPPAAQRLFLLEQQRGVATNPWHIAQGVVVLTRPCRLTMVELEQIMFECKRSMRKLRRK